MASQLSGDKLILIGFMGTGKSSVSRLLADKLGWSRIDSDEEIERSENRKISDIFAVDGEEGFRTIETSVLNKLLTAKEPAVIATGGGAVLREENRNMMLENGFVAALHASPEQIIARVSADTSRPLLQGDLHNRVHTLLDQRKGIYEFAHLTVDTTELTVEEVVDQILKAWNQFA